MAAAAPPAMAILGRATKSRGMLIAALIKQQMAIACTNSLRFCEVLRFCAEISFLLSAVVFSFCLCLDFFDLRLIFNITFRRLKAF